MAAKLTPSVLEREAELSLCPPAGPVTSDRGANQKPKGGSSRVTFQMKQFEIFCEAPQKSSVQQPAEYLLTFGLPLRLSDRLYLPNGFVCNFGRERRGAHSRGRP